MEQTRQIRGGISTLKGVRFEIMAVLYELPDLLEGRLNSVRYQPLSSAVSPGQPSAIVYVDDYSVEEENGHKRYAQVKQNTRSANWTINNPLAEGVIKQFWDQHQTDLESSLLFVSDKPATQLKNLADYSRSAISAEEFLSKATQRVKGDADDITKSLDISIDELWEMLKVTDCILRTEQTVSDRLVDYATDRYSVAEKFALVLKDFVERSPGMQLTKDLIVRELEEKGLFRLPVSVSQDTGAILHTSSGALRNYRSDILGLHIDRKETSLLESWIVESSDERPVAFLLDVAGSGKSVIMHDLLEKLEKNNVPVLGVKADVLGSIRSISDLQAALGLPDSTESILSAAAINGKAVLLIDQLDALSFNLARDQETLDTIIGLIGRASSIAGIYVIVSCRAFDRKFDPKLRQIHSSREFTIQPLKDSEIQLVLSSLGLDYEGLSPREQELLSNPHHLDLFATTISETLKRDAPRHSVTSVQQLYDLLWDLKINSSPTPNLSSFQLRDAIYGLADLIDETQELFQPVQVFDEMHEAKDYLESAGIFKREGNRLGFFHQSFFDYCYARRFLDQEKSLGESIKKGDQGFFVRPQVIQTLNYLRDINNPRCVEELKVLTDGALIHEWMRRLKAKPGKARLLAFKFLSHAASPPVRYHMRILVFAWFGQLRNLTDAEKEFGRTRLNSHYDLHPFLLGAQGNEEWFDVIQSRLPELLSMPEDNVDVDIMPFLRSVEENRPREVFGVLSNQLGQSREWSSRVVWCLNSHKAWESSEAEECLLWVCENTEEPWYSLDLALYNVGKANPNVAARALKVVLERLRQQMEAEPPSIEEEYLSSQTAVEDQDAAVAAAMARSRKSEDHLRKLLPRQMSWFDDLVSEVSTTSPSQFLDIVLPWLEQVLPAFAMSSDDTGLQEDKIFSTVDMFESGNPENIIYRACLSALGHVADQDEHGFLNYASRMENSRFRVFHRVLAQVLAGKAEHYGSWSLEYLLKDTSRFHIGELSGSSAHSAKLVAAIFPCLDTGERAKLEQSIFSYYPPWELTHTGAGRRGSDQLELLWDVPDALLTADGTEKRNSLRDRFSNYTPPEPRSHMRAEVVRSPIPNEEAVALSDEEWLALMRRYDDDTGWGMPRRAGIEGGVVELSRHLGNLVRADPSRFISLASEFGQDISSLYVSEFLKGLAESPAAPSLVFSACRTIWEKRKEDPMVQKAICEAVSKRAKENIPHELTEVVRTISLTSPDPGYEAWKTKFSSGEFKYEGDPHFHGINSTRGTAVRAYVSAMLGVSSIDTDSLLSTVEQIADDDSSAVRACVVETLPYMLRFDGVRVVNIFNIAVEGRPEVLATKVSGIFIYYALAKHSKEILKHISMLKNSDKDDARETCGSLATLAFFDLKEAESLHRSCARGDPALRRGVTEVLARNVDQPKYLTHCLNGLFSLVNDGDKSVREAVGGVFRHLPLPNPEIRRFVLKFIGSKALVDSAREVVEYAARAQAEDSELALAIAERVQLALGTSLVDMRTSAALLDDDLVSLAISIHTRSTDPDLKDRALDLFERVLDLGSRYARTALESVDR